MDKEDARCIGTAVLDTLTAQFDGRYTVEIQRPELEPLVCERIRAGRYVRHVDAAAEFLTVNVRITEVGAREREMDIQGAPDAWRFARPREREE